jgi:cell division protein FtsI/penicillin-binding protein 2
MFEFIFRCLYFLFFISCICLISRGNYKEYTHNNTYDIYDRNNYPLVCNVYNYNISIKSWLVDDAEKVYLTIKHLTNMSYEDFCEKLKNQKSVMIVENTNKLYPDKFDKSYLDRMKHPSIKIERKAKRMYTLGSGSTILGVKNEKIGLKKILEIAAEDSDVHTTIDSQIQEILNRLAKKHNAINEAKETFGIIVNDKFEIISACSTKAPDSNNIKDFSFFLYKTYQLGSTIKPLTVWGGLHYGAIQTNIPVFLTPGKYIDKRLMKDTEPLGSDHATIDKILYHSSQIGVVAIAKKMSEPNKTLADFFRNELEFNKNLSVIGLNTVKPFFPDKPNVSDVHTMSFGYVFSIPVLSAIKAYMLMILGKRGELRIIAGPEISEPCEISGRKDVARIMQKVGSRSDVFVKYGGMGKSGTVHVWNQKRNSFSDEVNNFYFLCIPHKNGFLFCYFGMMENKRRLLGMRTVRLMAEELVEELFSKKIIEPVANINNI